MVRGYVGAPTRQIHYLRSGSGPTLVLLHSSAQSSRAFGPVIAALPGFSTLAPDIAGFGQSDPRPGRDIWAYADDVRYLLDELGIQRAHMLGLHTGNKIATALAVEHGDRVESLVLVGMSHSIIPGSEARNRAIIDYLGHRPGTAAGRETGGGPGPAQLSLWLETLASVQKAWLSGPDTASPGDLDVRAAEALDRIQALPGHDAMYDANLSFDWGALLNRVACPTLLVELTPPDQTHMPTQAAAVAASIPGCVSIEIALNDRDLLQRHSARLAAVVTDFLCPQDHVTEAPR